MLTLATLILSGLVAHAAPDINDSYEGCVKNSADDRASAQCLDVAGAQIDAALTDVVTQLLGVLNASDAAKAQLLRDAHAKWLPSRDADCALRAAVTMESAEDAADAAKLCRFQANVPRLRDYRRFLGFLKN